MAGIIQLRAMGCFSLVDAADRVGRAVDWVAQ